MSSTEDVVDFKWFICEVEYGKCSRVKKSVGYFQLVPNGRGHLPSFLSSPSDRYFQDDFLKRGLVWLYIFIRTHQVSRQ